MENTTAEFSACPHCGGRLVAGATICLHCNEEVSAPPDDHDGALRKFIFTALVLIGIVGAAAVGIVQLVNSGKERKAPPAATSDESASGDTICVEVKQLGKISALTAKGMREVDGKPGQRCFAK